MSYVRKRGWFGGQNKMRPKKLFPRSSMKNRSAPRKLNYRQFKQLLSRRRQEFPQRPIVVHSLRSRAFPRGYMRGGGGVSDRIRFQGWYSVILQQLNLNYIKLK